MQVLKLFPLYVYRYTEALLCVGVALSFTGIAAPHKICEERARREGVIVANAEAQRRLRGSAMVKISRNDMRLSRLKTPTLAESKILARSGLQQLIWHGSEDFCLELGQDLLIIGEEVQPSTVVGDRIDLLAIDGDGTTVI